MLVPTLCVASAYRMSYNTMQEDRELYSMHRNVQCIVYEKDVSQILHICTRHKFDFIAQRSFFLYCTFSTFINGGFTKTASPHWLQVLLLVLYIPLFIYLSVFWY